jgi:DNA-binding IclR family transcriptional regulator
MSRTIARLLGLPPKDGEKSDRQFVTALARGLEVLRAFEPQNGPLGNQEIAARTGLPKPTISRITHTLTELGYLEHLPRLAKYRIGLSVLALGHACIGAAALRTVAHPHMQELASYANAAVALGGRDRLSMIYLDVCRGSHTAAFTLDAGARVPIERTAMGYAYLWALPSAERQFLLNAICDSTGPQWSTVKRQLFTAFKALDRTGFCIAQGTYERSLNGVGAPLTLQNGGELRAVSCSGPAYQLTAKRLQDDVGPRLLAMAHQVQEEVSRQPQAL